MTRKTPFDKKKCKVCGCIIKDSFQYCYKHNPNKSAFAKTDIEASNKAKTKRAKLIFESDVVDDFGGDDFGY